MTSATIPSFTKLTRQQVFDKSARHLLKQGKRSYSKAKGSCMYAGPKGIGCAASPFLRKQMRKQMDGTNGASWHALCYEGLVPEHNRRLIESLQYVHDNHEPREWAAKLRALAVNTKLQYEHIKALRA